MNIRNEEYDNTTTTTKNNNNNNNNNNRIAQWEWGLGSLVSLKSVKRVDAVK